MGKEMFLVLSDDYLGTEYVVSVYHDIRRRTILGLGNPTSDDITVSLIFPEKRNFEGNLCPNERLNLTLQSNEAKSLTFSCDITGTRINSSEKLIVYTASIPLNNSGGAEYLLEQLLPITLWGTHYVVVPLGDRPYGNVLTIVTAFDDTTIHISGYDFVTIPNKYDKIQRRVDLDTPLTIRSSQVVSVLQTCWFLSGDSGSVNLIPFAFKTDLQKTFDDTDYLTYGYIYNIGYNGSEYVPLSNYFAYRNQSELSTTAQGCTVTSATPKKSGGTHCGFSKDKISDSVWPNKSHLTTEELEEIFSCFSDIGDISSENHDTFGTLFVVPNGNFNTSIFCLIGGYDSQHIFSEKQIFIKQHTKTGCEDVLHSIVNNSISLNVTSPVIILTNQSELSLSCQYKGNDSSYDTNIFIVPPVDILSTEYIVTFPPIPPDDADGECLILSLFNNTSYAIPPLNVSDTIQRMQQKRISSMATGMFIVANKVISVLCYMYYRNNQYIINHPLPSSGFYFQLMKSQKVTEEEFVMVSTEGNTALTFDMGTMEGLNYTRLHKRNALLQNMGENKTYTWKENISTLFITANKPVLIAVYFRQNETTSDSTPFSPNGTNFVYVPPTFDVIWQKEESSTYLSQNGWPSNFRVPYRVYLSTLNQFLPGDGEDNDQDGLVDEDNCLYFKDDYKAEVPSDLDLDGSDGEDCKGCLGGEGMNMFLTCEACDYGFYRERKSWKLICQSCGENYTTFYQSSSSQNDCVPICTEGMQLNNDTLYRENFVTVTSSPE
ncbi:uncharacterized protein LOC134262768, partial [Saccostrea cucullata]|uniref:uncharacterized protein LOC134262768 n=1 Tax=Saccostrea cuccullata TaxID=36930 RepID=UPI002ED1A5C0